MLSNEFNLDTFLQTVEPDFNGSTGIISPESDTSNTEAFSEEGYEGAIDYRIRQLSYSSLLTLHTCPRKYQLYKLRTSARAEESTKSTVTFAFGHVVGEAIAMSFEGHSLDDIIWKMYCGWHTDLAHRDDKLEKSFWSAVIAIQRFDAMRAAGLLSDYDLVYYSGKPAAELSFCINFPDGFRLRGFVDAVLKHRISGKVVVLECKTTGAATINPATYKNSAQAIGYSIVLDVIFPELSSYEVLYLIYQTKAKEFSLIPFEKTYLQRALWIRELLLDIETIKMYEDAEVYPMRGESCFSFFRECEYYNVCTLSTEYLTKPCTPKEEDTTVYDINLSLEDLLTTQLEKTST